MKYTEKIKQKIFELVSSGEYNDKEVQEIVGISHETWHDWKNNKSEFSELLKKADDYFMDNQVKKAARKGLKTLLEGKEWEEVTVDYKLRIDKETGKETAKKVGEKRVKKFIMPNPISVIFALKNSDSDNFKDKQDIEHSGEIKGQPPQIIIQPAEVNIPILEKIEDNEK